MPIFVRKYFDIHQGLSTMTLPNTSRIAAIALAALLATACATKSDVQPMKASSAAATAPAPDAPRVVKSKDGETEGEVRGTPVPGSKFSKLAIGMQSAEVQNILDRAPDRSHSHESGKRWIPFYFGDDVRRTQALFKGEGCLTFTGGNAWGGGGGDLIGINHDPSGACYQP